MSRTGAHLKIRRMGDTVHGVELLGDPSKPEPESFRVMFPGGDVDVVRLPSGDYWIHVRVNNPAHPNGICEDDVPGRLVDARLDVVGKHASETDAGDFADPGLYHLAVRVARGGA